jgi:hypothetical protein
MEREDLLTANAQIFTVQGKALWTQVASRSVKVLVVGNPANTNAYIAMKSAPSLPAKNFTAMLRLDHNRAASQIAAKIGCAVGDIEKLIVWGNHSPTMYADYRFATRERRSGEGHSSTMMTGTPGCIHSHGGQARCRDHRSTWPVFCCIGSQRRHRSHPRLGSWAPTASGSRWASRPRETTASRPK